VRTAIPPTAVSNTTGEVMDTSARLMQFEAPIVTGSGHGLPALLGLRSIESKRGVLETGEPAFLTFPGPGGYKVVWEPGAIHLPLVRAPSGHLCVVFDRYAEVDSSVGGIPQKEVTLLAELDTATPGAPSSSASSN
jgi:hypothetical protein